MYYPTMANFKEVPIYQEVDELAMSHRPPQTEWTFCKFEGDPTVTLMNDSLTVVLNEVDDFGFNAAGSSKSLERKLHHFIEFELNSPAVSSCGFGLLSLCPSSTSKSSEGDVWELQPSGEIFKNRQPFPSVLPWGKGDRVGLHVDRWNGKIEFYLNGTCLGPLFEDQESRKELQERESLSFYVYSTSPDTIFTLRTAVSCSSTLQLRCLLALRSTLKPRCRRTPVYKALAVDKKNQVSPGLLRVIMKKWWWVSMQKTKQTPTRSSPRLAEKREKARLLMRHTFPKLSYTSVMSTMSL